MWRYIVYVITNKPYLDELFTCKVEKLLRLEDPTPFGRRRIDCDCSTCLRAWMKTLGRRLGTIRLHQEVREKMEDCRWSWLHWFDKSESGQQFTETLEKCLRKEPAASRNLSNLGPTRIHFINQPIPTVPTSLAHMDAQAYLRKQGWRGSGHSLDHTNRGITKPLLVSKKVDVLGVGLNKHAAVSDQWWLRAFDAGLQSLGTGKESALAQVQKHGVNRGGLYGRFVKGEGVPGTFGTSVESSTATSAVGSPKPEAAKKAVEVTPLKGEGKKRKRDGEGELVGRSKDAKAARKAAKAEKKKSKSKRTTLAGSDAESSKAAEEKNSQKAKGRAVSSLDPAKQALYAKRAAEKGVSLEDYVKRRQVKYAEKKAGMANKT